jgi:FlaG/FlaF family flagellin (archaellin)
VFTAINQVRKAVSVKKSKIIGLAVLVAIVIIVVAASSGSKKPAVKAAQAPSSPPIALNYVLNKNDGSFITVTATINSSYATTQYLPALCKYFSEEAAANSKEYYAGNVFDDATAPQYLGTTNNLTTAQNNDFNDHYILNYNYNPTTHNNVCNIFYGGQNGKEQSITY